MSDLLFEIGTEEIPAGYINPALESLSSLLLSRMKDARLECGETRLFGTPRRLAVIVENVSDKQKTVAMEVTGPPEKIAYDEDGNPTVAAVKFAEKAGVAIDTIKVIETKKGRYLSATITEKSIAAKILLKSILPDVVKGIQFPKTMRWGELNLQFARPIHSLLAILGSSVISFELENIKSGRYTRGHRFMCPGRIKIGNADEYVQSLLAADVLVDIEHRRDFIKEEISKAAVGTGGRLLPDMELLDIVTNLVEYPAVAAGKFDTKYLQLPDEVLITAMREHQKYFGVVDNNNDLTSSFIVVNNTAVNSMPVVTKGHERVLRARLEDARFFYKSDLDVPMDDWVEKLKGVLFQKELGSMYEKTERVEKIAVFLAIAEDGNTDLGPDVARAARLCKADLVSQVVGEFPKLQGIMGRIYTDHAGERKTVGAAVEEHYLPTYSGGPLPRTDAGAILGIADKIDSICGCFSAGLIPTGASDPYALRRQGIGIIQIMLKKGFSFSIRDLVTESMSLFTVNSSGERDENIGKVYTFLRNRMAHILAEEGFSKDVITAVTSVSVDHISEVWAKVRALEKLKSEPDFEPLAIAFKRVVNIIKKADNIEKVDVDESLFEDNCEAVLYKSFREVRNQALSDFDRGSIDSALIRISSLRDPVDSFFDGVMVMADDDKLRNNRLALLGEIAGLFGMFADFSKIST